MQNGLICKTDVVNLREARDWQSKVRETVKCNLMVLWKVASPFTSDWRALAQYLVAINEGIRFLEGRKDYHESPTRHIINVVETMKMPLNSVKDIFTDLGRDGIVRMLNLEISPNLQDDRSRFMNGSPLLIEDL